MNDTHMNDTHMNDTHMNDTHDSIPTTWREYAMVAARTAVYPYRGNNLPYAALGLAGESAEVFAARGTNEVLAEVGDVCWYVAAVCFETGIDLDTLPVAPRATDGTGFDVLVIAAGRIAEAAKKTLRDDSGVPTPARVAVISDALTSVAAALATIAAEHGSSLDHVWQANAAKLAGRARNNTLHGDGDHR